MSNLRKNAHRMLQNGKATILIEPAAPNLEEFCRYRDSRIEGTDHNHNVEGSVILKVVPYKYFTEEWDEWILGDGVSFKQFDLYTEALEAALTLVNADWEEVQEKLDL